MDFNIMSVEPYPVKELYLLVELGDKSEKRKTRGDVPSEELRGAWEELKVGIMGGVDTAALVEGLRDVFMSGKTKAGAWRLEQLEGIVKLVTERKSEIQEAIKEDLNKPSFESYMEVVGIQHGAAGAAASLSDWMAPEKVSSPMPHLAKAAIMPEPLGVTLVISAWNYPFRQRAGEMQSPNEIDTTVLNSFAVLALDPLIGAIAAGNVVVVKPSELAPATSALIAKLLPLYVDSSAIKVVEGGVAETTALLEQRWDKIFFTGGARVGKIIMAAAAKHLTPVTLELGGKSPTIVDSTTDLGIVAKRIARGKWGLTDGQACVAPDYILAEESIRDELVDKLKAALKEFFGEDPSKTADLARIITESHWDRLVGLLQDKSTADKIIHGGQSDRKTKYIAPTLVLDCPPDAPVMQEEIFGPILVILTVKNVDEAIKSVNTRPKPLALYLFSNDEKVQEKVLEQTSSGGVTINDTVLHVSHPNLPFGGVGESGTGAYHGKYSFDAFSHKKSVLWQDLATGTATFVYPPYTMAF